MIKTDIEQRSLDWYRIRLGHITGSKVSDLMKTGRKKGETFGQTAKSYMYQIAGERMFNDIFLHDDDLFGDYVEQTNITTKAMQWGIEQEDAAKNAYMQVTFKGNDDYTLVEPSSCTHDTIDRFAASPDGIIYDKCGKALRILEVKCPNIATYMLYRTEIHDGASLKEVKPEYYWQVMAEMACTGIPVCDFITYCPWLSRPLHIATIERNDEDVALMENRVLEANKLIDDITTTKKQAIA